MDRYGHNVRSDVKKQGYENSDLPILCETCLGENPYVRIIREENGKECQICKNAFTLFRWKPGHNARYKQTIICNKCAKVKNVCQTCLFDLEYNLPVQVRDKFLETSIALPENETNRNFFLEQLEKNISTDTYDKISHGNMDLSKLKRKDPYFKRNMARVCSFWRKNACNRGDECPYLHKEIHLNKSLANQSIKSRYTGENDVLAETILNRYKNNNIDEKNMANKICIQGISDSIRVENVKECFKKFGEIKSFKMIPKDSKIFISYATLTAAKNAAEKYKDGLELNGCNLTVTLQQDNINNNIWPSPPFGQFNPYPPQFNHNNKKFSKNNNFKPHNPPPPNSQPNMMNTVVPPMYFPYNNPKFNSMPPNAIPYASMLPSEAEQRK
ncbi:RNA-binding protein, putative [Plasmodium chabaudi adami]|uniref:RNA-binding protein, putative n=1 Tax=Plasmodium chabaudi adami TaxID=5826 RepID=A0A1C6YQT9_PLACE|nr:RNA-binding protein, putative [Plasmodium chabaudi adami]SCN63701.1 RNA-binding protein, putative [Plasmodium chabaudi adami]